MGEGGEPKASQAILYKINSDVTPVEQRFGHVTDKQSGS